MSIVLMSVATMCAILAAPDSPHPSLFTALEEQLGLRPESQKGPVEFIVLEKVAQLIPD
jgi:uncharacterized protein (TIGR03435 family)